MKRKRPFMSGTVTTLQVYNFDGVYVGHGWFLFSNEFGMGRPNLSDFDGNMLPPDFYQLHPVEVYPTIWNDTEH